MKSVIRFLKFFAFDTFGWVAVASLIICGISGTLLAVSYDVAQPLLSVSRLITANPAASLVRNLHYWSAQLFLILLIVHVIEHFYRSTEEKLAKKSLWLHITLLVFFSLYAMISGFILKADADSFQAHRIISSLVKSIPLAGNLLYQTFIGSEKNMQLIYIQHAATATVIIFVVTIEHVRSLKVKATTFLVTLAGLVIFSLFLRAPFAGNLTETMKGPWYFVGLQEIMHWVSRTAIVGIALLALLLLFFALPFLKKPWKQSVKWFFAIIFIFYVLLTVIALFFRGNQWKWQWPFAENYQNSAFLVPVRITFAKADSLSLVTVNGQVEGCMSCHATMQGFSDAHKPYFIGCHSCHGGDGLTLDKQQAHRGMYAVPGNLSNAESACGMGGCHSTIVGRVQHSMMTKVNGIVSVDKYVFGENATFDGYERITDIGFSPAETHLRNLCANCHLGNEKTLPGKAKWLQRGGGCLACHLDYDSLALATLNALKNKKVQTNSDIKFHPALSLNIVNDKCLSCHSRSGRIATNYEGWHETALKPAEVNNKRGFRLLPDGRVFKQMHEDVHHAKNMFCVDCHTSYELMGDGKDYAHKEQAVKVQCADCHTAKQHEAVALSKTNTETQLVAWLRKYNLSDKVLQTEKEKQALVNTRLMPDGKVYLLKKSGGKPVLMKSPIAACRQKVHSRLSCEACHTAWAPQCIGCHNSYEAQTKGFDMLANKPRQGAWVEYADEGLAELPVLGVDENDKTIPQGKIKIFAPGMIISIDKSSFDKKGKEVFHRLYAPSAAHTTTRNARSCASCHNQPLALGYGRGTLAYTCKGKWQFEPAYQNSKYDGLPEDAWTGFLAERKELAATRVGMRPLNLAEQQKTLTVGACLTCHNEQSNVMQRALADFAAVKKQMSSKCVMPKW